LTVDAKTLYRLAHRQPIQRADMEVAGAAAAILGIGLDDLFEVQAVPIEEPEDGPDTALLPEQSRRLSELFDAQSRRGLTSDERQEIETLVADYGRRLHESRLQEIARKRGVTVEKARRQVADELDEATEWWRAINADPRRRRQLEQAARQSRGRGVVSIE